MEKKRADRRKLLEVLVVTVFLAYGIHYFGYFLRTRYFGLIAPIKGTDPGLHSVLRYLGHLILLTAFAVYAFSIRDGRKYLEVFLPKRENNRLSKLLLGMLIGMVMNGVCVVAAVLHGDLTVRAAESVNVGLLILAFFAVLIQASVEELETRVFVFGRLEEGGFSFIPALILSSMYFSYLHSTNPSFGLVPFINITASGIVYALIYRYTGSVWAACGLHQMWNVTQDFIFGLPNSGNPSTMSVFATTANSSSFFYNVDFGVEGSIWSILVHAVVAAVLLILIRKKEGSLTAKA